MFSIDWQIRHHKTLLIVAGVSLTLFFPAVVALDTAPEFAPFVVLVSAAGVMISGPLGIYGLYTSHLRTKTYGYLDAAMAAEPTLHRLDRVDTVSVPALAAQFDTCTEGVQRWIPAGVNGLVNLDVLGESHIVNCSGFLWSHRTRRAQRRHYVVRAMGMVALPSQASANRRVVVRWAGDPSARHRAAAKVLSIGRTSITGNDEPLKAAILGASAQSLLGVSAEPRIVEIRGRFLLLVDPNEARDLASGLNPQMVDRMLALRREAAQLAEVILTLDQLGADGEGFDDDGESGAGR